jgi:hypothetical protein
MKAVVSKLEVLGLSHSYQFCLLKELVSRALRESCSFSI